MHRRCLFPLLIFSTVAVPLGMAPHNAVSETIPATKRLPATTVPKLLVPDGNKQRSLALTRAGITVDIAGYLAQTTVTLTFSNDTNRILEGELVFPLPEGVTISGYGLDVKGEIVEGVPVEKQAARIAFEKEVRKGIDPGLVEQTEGNVYRTRVYPIPAHGSRTLRLRWTTELETDPTTGKATYILRQRTENILEKLSLRISTNHAPGVPRSVSGGTGTPGLAFVKTGSGYIAEQTRTNAALTGDLTVSFTPDAQAGPITAVEPFTRASATAPETFFTITDTVPDAPTRQFRTLRSVPRRRIGIVWDASLSRRQSNINRECQILSALLQRWSAQQGQALDVEVTLLRDKTEPPRLFAVQRGDTRALITYLKNITYDGGTNFSALNLNRPSMHGKRDAWLLFTDGLSNLGASEIPNTAGVAPVFAFASDVRANHGLLRLICARTHGVYLNLDRFARNVDVVERVVSPSPYSLVSITSSPRGAVNGLYPSTNQAVDSRGRITATGKLLASQATITFAYGYDKNNITSRRTVTVRRADAPRRSQGLVARYWAQHKADSLAPLARTNHDTLLKLGQDFGIVTPGTSLLVLETLEQHLEYHIAPARSRASLYDAYLGKQQQLAKENRRQETSRLTEVTQAWKERVRWWSQPISKLAPKKRTVGQNGAVAQQDGLPRTDAGIRITQRVVGGSVQYYAASGGTASQNAATNWRPQVMRRQGVVDADSAISANSPAPSQEAKLSASETDNFYSSGPEITIQAWSPKMPYITAMRAAGAKKAYSIYLAQRSRYQKSPAFYLDCAEFLLQRGQTELGIRVLTNVAELGLEDPQLLRIVAHRLAQAGRRDLAILQFERIRTLRPEEPQSLRDLALVLIDRGDDRITSSNESVRKQGIADYNRGLALLYQVVLKRWDRFDGIEEIALMEAGRTVARARGTLSATDRQRLVVPFPKNLLNNLYCDTRILMTWDTDDTDMDLWVTEPTGEKCYYSHNRTTIGGRLSNDFTDGYGPEEYLLRHVMPGKYRIQSNYYGTHQQKLTGGTTVQATVITNWGKNTEKRRYLTLRLTTAKETVDIGTIVQEKTKK
jgi:Ca-activated chloride channel family protein